MKDLSIKRIAGITLSVLGILLSLFALVYGAIRSTSTSVEVKAAAEKSTFITTAPGVLGLYNGAPVTITADIPKNTPPGTQLLWAIGRSEDVLAYVGESSVTQVAGLQTSTEAKVSAKPAKAQVQQTDTQLLRDGTLVMEKSDLWEKSGRESKKLKLEYTVPANTQRSFIAASTAGIAPDITIRWQVKAQGFPTVQVVIIGILISLVGVYLLFADSQSRARVNYFRKREANRKAHRAAQAGALTEVLPIFKGDLAAPETDRKIQREHTESAFGASILPGTSRTSALRARELSAADRIVIPVSSEPDKDTGTAVPEPEKQAEKIENRETAEADSAPEADQTIMPDNTAADPGTENAED
ncbi:hypothetical protein RQN30_04640 [Arcanobacterium hippocoleae]